MNYHFESSWVVLTMILRIICIEIGAELQEILNGVMQGIVSIITSALGLTSQLIMLA